MPALASSVPGASPRIWLFTRESPVGHSSSTSNTLVRWLDCRILMLIAMVVITAVPFTAHARGLRFYMIDGDALAPSVPSGALIVVDPNDTREFSTGDLVMFRDERLGVAFMRISEVVRGSEGVAYRGLVAPSGSGQPLTITDTAIQGRVSQFVPGAAMTIGTIASPSARIITMMLAIVVVAWRVTLFFRPRQHVLRGLPD